MRLLRIFGATRTRKPGFFDLRDFPLLVALEEHAPAIKHELAEILPDQGFQPWPESTLYNSGWDVFGFYFFGRKFEANCTRCPRTAALVARIPGLTSAGFSRLAPGTRIRPHVGYTKRVLRCHLGVAVPPTQCAMRVGDETRAWADGKCLIFDDTVEHEAWNLSDKYRVVLLVDFEHGKTRAQLDRLRHTPSNMARGHVPRER